MIEKLMQALAIPELRKRIRFVLFTFLLFAIGAHIPVPGVDHDKMEQIFNSNQGNLLGLIDVFSGGALRRMSVFALGIAPYINASIIMQVLTFAIPQLEAISKEGESGRKKIAKISRYLTIVLAFVQSFGIIVFFRQNNLDMNIFQILGVMCSLVAGSMFLLWLGEQVTQKGIGNGVSLMILAGILLSMPYQFSSIVEQVREGTANLLQVAILITLFVLMTIGVVYLTQGIRRIPLQHTKRVIGMRQTQAGAAFLPIKLNSAGVIPIIFAISLVLLPQTLVSVIPGNHPFINWMREAVQWCNPGNIPTLVLPIPGRPIAIPMPIALIVYFFVVIIFTYFYTSIVMNIQEMSDNLKKYGNYIPGIRPGKPTQDYLERVISRVTLAGSFALGLIAVSQYILPNLTGFSQNTFTIIGGTSLLIVVQVAIETMQAIEAQMLMRNYEGFIKDK